MIVSSCSHVAPSKSAASQRMAGEPPSARIFFSLPSAENPTHCPSGEKNGTRAPVVPGISFATVSSSRRRYRCWLPSASSARKTSHVPSGAMAMLGLTSPPSVVPALIFTSSTTGRASLTSAPRHSAQTATDSATPSTAAADFQAAEATPGAAPRCLPASSVLRRSERSCPWAEQSRSYRSDPVWRNRDPGVYGGATSPYGRSGRYECRRTHLVRAFRSRSCIP